MMTRFDARKLFFKLHLSNCPSLQFFTMKEVGHYELILRTALPALESLIMPHGQVKGISAEGVEYPLFDQPFVAPASSSSSTPSFRGDAWLPSLVQAAVAAEGSATVISVRHFQRLQRLAYRFMNQNPSLVVLTHPGCEVYSIAGDYFRAADSTGYLSLCGYMRGFVLSKPPHMFPTLGEWDESFMTTSGEHSPSATSTSPFYVSVGSIVRVSDATFRTRYSTSQHQHLVCKLSCRKIDEPAVLNVDGPQIIALTIVDDSPRLPCLITAVEHDAQHDFQNQRQEPFSLVSIRSRCNPLVSLRIVHIRSCCVVAIPLEMLVYVESIVLMANSKILVNGAEELLTSGICRQLPRLRYIACDWTCATACLLSTEQEHQFLDMRRMVDCDWSLPSQHGLPYALSMRPFERVPPLQQQLQPYKDAFMQCTEHGHGLEYHHEQSNGMGHVTNVDTCDPVLEPQPADLQPCYTSPVQKAPVSILKKR
jgi:hypothetical protein